MLEQRRLLSTISWSNKGTGAGAGDTDGFNATYGANAAQARIIAQRAMDDWERVITNFNYSGGGNTFTLNFSATAFTGGLRGQTTNVTRQSSTRRAPISATIQIDDNGGGSGWYFDSSVGTTTIPDDGEFTNIAAQFDADFPTATGYDFYRTCAHEIGHAMGLLLNTNGYLLISDVTTALNITDPVDSGESLYGVNVNGGASDYTLTSSGGGHLFEGGGTFSGPTSPFDLLNAGRNVPTGTRRLISDDDARLLRDVYGYTVTLPGSINTFYANLNRTTDVLTVTGDINDSGSDVDSITIDVVGTDTRVRMNGTTELIPNAEYTTLVVNAGGSGDTININSLPAGKTVTVNGDAGNDTIVLSDLDADLDTGIDSNVTINGGAGTDSVRADDQNDGVGGDTYTFGDTFLNKGGRIFTVGTLEQMTVNASAQPSVFNVNATDYALIVNGGAGNETLNVGGGDIDSNLSSAGTTLNGGGGVDSLVFNDTTDGVGGDTYTLTTGLLNKGGRVVNYATVEGLVVNASAQNSTFNVNSLGNGVPVTINGGAGNETFNVGDGDLDTNLFSNVTVNGGAGTDSVTFDDSLDGAGANTYVLTSTSLTKSTRVINYSGFESLVISGSVTAAAYSINGSSGANTVVNGGAADDTITVGGGDVDTNLGANITVNGGLGADQLIFDDTADGAGADVATFTLGQVVKGAQTFIYSSFVSLIWNGATLATTYNVNATSSATPVTVNGGAGNDTFNVGGGDFDSLVRGDVHVGAGGGTDRIVLDDTADDTSVVDTYDVNSTSFTKSSSGGVSLGWGGLLIFGSTGLEQFVLNANVGDSAIHVNSTGTSGLALPPNPAPVYPIAVTVNAGGGNDQIQVVAPGGTLGSIRGDLTVNGDAGSDVLTFNDGGDTTADSFTVTQTTLTNSNWDYTATYNASTEGVNVQGGTVANTFNLNKTAGGPAINFIGNAGNDVFNLQEGTATLIGGAGLENVDVNIDGVGSAGFFVTNSEDWNQLRMYAGSTGIVTSGGGKALDVQDAGTLRGTLDLTDNYMVVRSPATSFLVDKLTRGYNAGGWNGVPAGGASGVITTSTAGGTTLNDSLGYATIGGALDQLNKATYGSLNLSAGNLLIAYTLVGDTDLDRDVDFNDLLSLAKNYNTSPRNWVQGDVTYNGTVNFDDLLGLAKTYNQSLPAPAAESAPAASEASALVDDSAGRKNVGGSLAEDPVV